MFENSLNNVVGKIMKDKEYQKIECIKRLEESYKADFIEIVEYYRPEFVNKIQMGKSVYTLHDFNHHCVNIYKIISEVILFSKIAYQEETGLNEKELYILDLAVLFHDFGMFCDLESKRDDHSRRSAEFLTGIYHSTNSFFRKKCNLNENELRALKLIVMAHSDIKGENIPDNQNGLNNPELMDEIPGAVQNIRVKFLACILRLADELDITVARLGNDDYEAQLEKYEKEHYDLNRKITECNSESEKSECEKRIKEIQDYIESYKHWKRLHLFSQVHRKATESDEVYLEINDEYVKQKTDEGANYESIVEEIFAVVNKIDKEYKDGLQRVIEASSNKLTLNNMIGVRLFTIVSKDENINRLIDKNNFLNREGQGVNSSKEPQEHLKSEDDVEPKVIDADFQSKIGKWVKRRHLLRVGHFLLDEIYCARDWIDTQEIIETRKIIDDIVSHMVQHISANFSDLTSCLILGLDLEGAVLASRIGTSLQLPFSYLIPAKESENNAGKDMEISIGSYDNYIIVTDEIATYQTIKRVLKNSLCNIGIEKILQIYTIFYRQPINNKVKIDSTLVERTSCVNQEFRVELFPKDKCQYNKEFCYGMNRSFKGGK